MAVQTITRGLTRVEFADLAPDGGPGTNFQAIGYTWRDEEIVLLEEDPEVNDLFTHELDDSIDREYTGGVKELTFNIVDPDLSTLSYLFGGAVSGSGDSATYGMPAKKYVGYKTVRLVPAKGLVWTINRAAVIGTVDANFSRGDVVTIAVSATVLVPEKSGVMPITVGPNVSTMLTGPITSLALTSAGSGYANDGTYTNVDLTGGSGTGAQATVVVAGNAVTSVMVTNGGTGYKVGDVLSAAAADIGTGGTGFACTVQAITAV